MTDAELRILAEKLVDNTIAETYFDSGRAFNEEECATLRILVSEGIFKLMKKYLGNKQ